MNIDLLLKKFEFSKKMYLNSEGTPSEKEWEKKLMDCVEEMKKWQTSHRNSSRTTDAEKVRTMYALYTETPENTSKRKED